MQQKNKLLLICFFLALVTPNFAFAYIDPGSGSMILQLLLAGIAGLGMALKLYWRRFTSIFRRSSTQNTNQDKNS